jgi:hypothetical protein
MTSEIEPQTFEEQKRTVTATQQTYRRILAEVNDPHGLGLRRRRTKRPSTEKIMNCVQQATRLTFFFVQELFVIGTSCQY